MSIERIGVVVPAKNEQQCILGCLEALAVAGATVDLPVSSWVVLDDCSDATAEVVAGAGATLVLPVTSLPIRASSVGAARRAGMLAAIDALGEAGTWLATTDADTIVPAHWFARQLRHAGAGAAAVVGTVSVDDWSERTVPVRARAEADYRGSDRRHVHGANLSFRAESYLQVGGFSVVERNEDVALVAALSQSGDAVVWAADVTVSTSARRVSRAPGGFAAYLDELEELGELSELDQAAPLPAAALGGR